METDFEREVSQHAPETPFSYLLTLEVIRSEARLRSRARRDERADAERRIRRPRRPAQHRHGVDRWATADEDPGVPCET